VIVDVLAVGVGSGSSVGFGVLVGSCVLVGRVVAVGSDVFVGSGADVAVGSGVKVGTGLSPGVAVEVGITVGEGFLVSVGRSVGVAVNVDITVGDRVGACVGVSSCGLFVGTGVGIAVGGKAFVGTHVAPHSGAISCVAVGTSVGNSLNSGVFCRGGIATLVCCGRGVADVGAVGVNSAPCTEVVVLVGGDAGVFVGVGCSPTSPPMVVTVAVAFSLTPGVPGCERLVELGGGWCMAVGVA
jgi:hypothetical protein